MTSHMTGHMENENDNVNRNINRIEDKGVQGEKKRSLKATIEEITEYCLLCKNHKDCIDFLIFWSSV